jgi:hypothetical protein
MLATLRTAWLVEERSLMKTSRKRKSRYRILQYFYDATYFCRRFIRSLWKAVTGESQELSEFLNGLSINLSESRVAQVSSSIGAAVTALLVVNLMGALFAISPQLLSILAVGASVAWPTWPAEVCERASSYLAETRARGRGEEEPSAPSMPILSFDKTRYNYFTRKNGRKRYFRSGKPWFAPTMKKPDSMEWPWQKQKDSDSIEWPWQNQKDRRQQRGIFGK